MGLSKDSDNRNLFSLTFGLFITLVLCVLIEGISYILLQYKGYNTKFLINFQENEEVLQRYKAHNKYRLIQFNAIDPHLGYAHNIHDLISMYNGQDVNVLPGFIVYKSLGKGSDTLDIVTLGGSTADVTINEFSSPKSLFQLLKVKKNVMMYNGGVAGFSSSQELIKLIRDVIPLKPDIIISLNGINDMGFVHAIDDHPMVLPYQKRLIDYTIKRKNKITPILPSSVALIRSVIKKFVYDKSNDNERYINFGTVNKSTPVESWLNNIRIMHTICTEYNIQYFCFLQPVMGFGKYQMSDEECKWYNEKEEQWPEYFLKVEEFFHPAKEICNELDYCHDLTDIFNSYENVYADPRHQNEIGVKVIADSINAIIERKLYK